MSDIEVLVRFPRVRDVFEDIRYCKFCVYSDIGYNLSGYCAGVRYCRYYGGKRSLVRIVGDFDTCVQWKRCSADKEIAECSAEFRAIPLTGKKVVWVDNGDYESMRRFTWYAHRAGRTFYAARSCNGRIVYMHRMLLRPGEGMVVDHINHWGLDNRRKNLRVCSAEENSYNQRKRKESLSRYKGVSWNRHAKKWSAMIQSKRIGYFDDEVEAARAYDREARKIYGEFAFVNFRD